MELTIQAIKDTIAFDHSQGIGKTLCNLIDCNYKIKVSQGASEADAIAYAMNQHAKTMLNLANK